MEARRQPNILFVMVDQLMPFLTGAYGHPVVQTPNMDRLAREGVRFDAAYTPYPLCGPARAAFMVGKYASNIGVYDNAGGFDSQEPSISHYLGSVGYDCVASGKLHFVGPDQLHGFNRRLTTDIYPEDFSWLQNRDPRLSGDPAYQGRHAYQYTGDAIQIGVWRSNLSYDEEVQFRALEFIRSRGFDKRRQQAKGKDYQPFFLYTSFHHPHDPFWSPQRFWDLYEGAEIDLPEYPDDLDESYSILDRWLNEWHQVTKFDIRNEASMRRVRRAYYGLVSYVDEKLGALLDALREHGLEDETVVVFASDHGDMLGEKGMVQKRTFYEWSCRVPLLIRFPDHRSAGRQVVQPVSLLDLLPTFLDIGGVETRLPFDGHSLIPLIEGKDESWDVFAESHAEGVYGTCFMLRVGQYKYVYIRHEDGEDSQLFDLQTDPKECVNLVQREEYRELVNEFRRRLFAQFDPTQIEADIQQSFRTRALLKTWAERTQVRWDYAPIYDPTHRTADQYQPSYIEGLGRKP